MSVILDALRRQRKSSASTESGAASPSPTRQVPAGLGLNGSSAAAATSARPYRARLLGLGLLLVIGLGVWAAIQVARTLITNYAPPAQSAASAPPIRGTPDTPAVTPPQPPPPAAVESGAPMTAPPAESGAPAQRGNGSRRRVPTIVLRSTPRPRPDAQRQESRAGESVAPAQNPEPAVRDVAPGASTGGATHFELAVRYHNLGNYDEALTHYLAVLAGDGFNVEARNNLGLLYHRRGQTAEAIDQFRRAIAINPQYVRARSNLAVVLMDAGRLAEARAELRAAMTLEPRNADLIVNLALVEKADQHRDQAIELLVRAIGYQPTHGMAHYNVAVLYEEQSALALAYDHYTAFLRYGGPEHGELLSDVQQRLLSIKPRLTTAR